MEVKGTKEGDEEEHAQPSTESIRMFPCYEMRLGAERRKREIRGGIYTGRRYPTKCPYGTTMNHMPEVSGPSPGRIDRGRWKRWRGVRDRRLTVGQERSCGRSCQVACGHVVGAISQGGDSGDRAGT
jgi:hypothetical protein